MNTAQRRASYSNFWLRYGYVNFYIIIMYVVIYLFIYLFGGYGPAGRERAARDADIVPPAEVASWDAARPRDADPPGEVVRREVVRPRDRDRPGKVARQDDARLRDVDTPPEISCRDVAQPRDPAPPDAAAHGGSHGAAPPSSLRPSRLRPPQHKGSFRPDATRAPTPAETSPRLSSMPLAAPPEESALASLLVDARPLTPHPYPSSSRVGGLCVRRGHIRRGAKEVFVRTRHKRQRLRRRRRRRRRCR